MGVAMIEKMAGKARVPMGTLKPQWQPHISRAQTFSERTQQLRKQRLPHSRKRKAKRLSRVTPMSFLQEREEPFRRTEQSCPKRR
jgi:hypothetical protein